ncbi:SAM-dependent methyltransferase [Thermococcus guaymasensis DSM 11113]|uniref:SAM-dependent methyltransferase n=1 Tax=Thermococcus guaymasensis DSM 11113 TaxID=1432656 RepID=A0A0X1KLC1_9EURY|nr:class I SAM-dependent methyltransferase [Thermococcus guaymasensis]AJC72062.1 SAM-dependent methyltransferase [Thermococcus guaymasensis DSM 11113]
MEELYRYLRAYMDPKSEVAQRRFIALRSFFNWAVKEGLLPDRRKLRILDLCAGTGIAGAALYETLREWGYEPSLTVVDKRKEDLLLVEEWVSGEVYGAVMDCLDDLSKLGKFDVALIFGYTMPHFDPFQAAELFRNVAKVLESDGVFLIEETDRFGAFFYRRAYREVVPEVRGEDYTVISLDEGYNPVRGVIKRGYYRLPGWEKIGEMETRYWDLAGLAGIGKALFEEARIIRKSEHGVVSAGDLIYLRGPLTSR